MRERTPRTPRTSGDPRGQAALSRAALALGACALAACVLGAGGCGRREPRSAGNARGTVATGGLDSLADEVERRFELATADEPAGGEARRTALAAVQELVRAVLAAERPGGGWTPEALESALRARRLAAQVREIERAPEPWIALVSDPRVAEVPELALLAFPASASLLRLQLDPFLHPFQSAVWADTLGPVLLVAGTRRSPAGPQPAAWLFRLPAKVTAASDTARFLPCAGEWGLAAAGAARVSFVKSDPDSAPRLAVTNSALPNPLFDECGSCPHLEADLEYRFDGLGLVPDKRELKRTPYAAFVGFVEALVAGDDAVASGYAAEHKVVDQARSLGFDRRPEGGRWRIGPGIAAGSLDQIYLRGQEGAYRVLFAAGDSGYVVTSISLTTFKLD